MAKKPTKRNPQDLTLRNNRKTRKDIADLTAVYAMLFKQVKRLTTRVFALEQQIKAVAKLEDRVDGCEEVATMFNNRLSSLEAPKA